VVAARERTPCGGRQRFARGDHQWLAAEAAALEVARSPARVHRAPRTLRLLQDRGAAPLGPSRGRGHRGLLKKAQEFARAMERAREAGDFNGRRLRGQPTAG